MRVAVGSVARKLLQQFGMALFSRVLSIGPVEVPREMGVEPWPVSQIENSPLRCADAAAEKAMIEAIDQPAGLVIPWELLKSGDGVVAGLGSHH